MTYKAMTDFATAARADSEMTKGLLAALGDKQGGAAAEAFAAYAQAQGFDVTREDVEALQQAVQAQESALSDAQLDVAGGGVLGDLFQRAWHRYGEMSETLGKVIQVKPV